ncbi:hypothetical protein NH514_15265 [Pseudoalteromonas sp. ACER1]|uniref:hypothetical protein n=1 Tax=unclassified Pseudoalteromonas TaxID=194690 RepID=UPI000AF217C2|nr:MULTISPECIES: hypothetical protein [unclassified Pseudoalteromonas]MCF2849847.1 hypothetical protein [Pseudoalteromonas sp. PAST1]MCF2917617.1 hypothetical protein [Pseudoalteromonas sp. Cn5-37]MCO7212089.1 hypothetical protein [Pseudoalteromonas sp. ACER1]
MNTNVLLKILLIISIVFQSFVAVSATLETHQLDVEHLQTIHDHEAEHSPQLDSDKEHDIEDCHHCGHCSGNHTSWILVKAFLPSLPLNHSHDFNKIIFLPLGISTRLYRPPTA